MELAATITTAEGGNLSQNFGVTVVLPLQARQYRHCSNETVNSVGCCIEPCIVLLAALQGLLRECDREDAINSDTGMIFASVLLAARVL